MRLTINLWDYDREILAMYAGGMNTREITEHLHDLYGIDVSPDLIDTVTEVVLDEVVNLQQRLKDSHSAPMNDDPQTTIAATLARAPNWIRQELLSKEKATRRRAEGRSQR